MKFTLLLSQTTFFSLVMTSPVKETHENDLVSVLDIKLVEQDGVDHVYDYSLKEKFSGLPLPSWLNNWDYLMFNTLGEKKYDVKVDPKAEDDAIAHMLLFSLASGFSVDTWHEAALQRRFEGANLNGMMNTLWDTGDISAELLESFPEEIEREAGAISLNKRYINRVSELRWNYHSDNRARVLALKQLKDNMDAENGKVVHLGRSAICETRDTWRGCLLWTGGIQLIRSNVAAHAIWSGIDGFREDEWVSARARDAFHDRIWNQVYWKEASFHVCLSNRPNGC